VGAADVGTLAACLCRAETIEDASAEDERILQAAKALNGHVGENATTTKLKNVGAFKGVETRPTCRKTSAKTQVDATM
jgi:hypothetical protein